MTLIERYLRAVKEQLPRAQQDDVIAELSENLRAQMEDEAEARGRPLADDEQAAILKRFGNPMTVAARYRGDARSVSFGRQLIGPELFPTYMKVLTINVVITLLVTAVLLIVLGRSFWSAVWGCLVPISIQFIAVTAIFMVADRHFARDPDDWDPYTVSSPDSELHFGSLDRIATMLNGPARPGTVPYTTSILDLAVSAITLAVSLSIGLPDAIGPMTAGPGWANLYVPVNVLLALSLIGPIVTLIRPTLTQFRVAARAAFDGAFLVVLTISLALGSWVVIVDPATAEPKLADVVGYINTAVRVSIAVAIVFTAVSFALEFRRLRQLRAA